VRDAFERGAMKYVGFTFPETPERLSFNLPGDATTQIWITVKLTVLLPFHEENEFTPGKPKTVKVKAYTKKDGTTVKEHYRTTKEG